MKKIAQKSTFHLFLLACFIVTNAYSKTYYVATDGNNNNQGTNISPYATINKAAEVAIAGDFVCVKSGIYKPTVVIKPANSGTELAPITYYAEVPGKAIIDGQTSIPTIVSREGLFFVSGKSHIVIDGLRIINSGFFGILIKDGSSNVVVKNCSTYNTGASGICGANSSFIKVLNNSVQRACYAPGGLTVNTSECITMASVNTFEVAYNTVFDRPVDVNNGGEGIDAKNACKDGKVHHNTIYDLNRVGLYVDSYKSALNNIEVYNNIVYNCISGLSVACEEGGTNTDVKVYNNLIYNCTRTGIRLAGYLSDGAMYNISVYNNTVNNCGYGAGPWENCGMLVEASNVLNTNFIIRNNIFSNNKIQIRTKNQSWLTLNNNLIFGANEASGTGTNTIIGDPLFTDALDNNFRLKVGSPAIDKAVGEPFSLFDFDDNARPFDGDGNHVSISDLGAFEYKPSFTTIEDLQNSSKILVYPNPANNSVVFQGISDNSKIELFGILGKKVLTKIGSTNNIKIYISDLNPGIYFYKVSNQNNISQTGKLLKE